MTFSQAIQQTLTPPVVPQPRVPCRSCLESAHPLYAGFYEDCSLEDLYEFREFIKEYGFINSQVPHKQTGFNAQGTDRHWKRDKHTFSG